MQMWAQLLVLLHISLPKHGTQLVCPDLSKLYIDVWDDQHMRCANLNVSSFCYLKAATMDEWSVQYRTNRSLSAAFMQLQPLAPTDVVVANAGVHCLNVTGEAEQLSEAHKSIHPDRRPLIVWRETAPIGCWHHDQLNGSISTSTLGRIGFRALPVFQVSQKQLPNLGHLGNTTNRVGVHIHDCVH
eukprot:364278-Prymnesium_polylepis.1